MSKDQILTKKQNVEIVDYSALSEKDIDEISKYHEEYDGPYDDCKYCGICDFNNKE